MLIFGTETILIEPRISLMEIETLLISAYESEIDLCGQNNK